MKDIVLDLYIATFAAREDLYVENSAIVRRERLTPDVLNHALDHHYGISAYTADAEGTTHVGGLDFDGDDGLNIALRVQQVLGRKDIPSLLLPSRRGAHLWVGVKDGRVAAGVMRRGLRAALHEASPLLTDDPKIEVFPKAGAGLAAGALRLPGLAHPSTGLQYGILGTSGGLVGIPLLEAILRQHRGGLRTAFSRLSRGFSGPSPYPKYLGEYRRRQPLTPFRGPTPKASVILQSWGIPNARPGSTVRCPRHDDQHRSLTIFADDERVICGAPGCPFNNDGHGIGSIMLSKETAHG